MFFLKNGMRRDDASRCFFISPHLSQGFHPIPCRCHTVFIPFACNTRLSTPVRNRRLHGGGSDGDGRGFGNQMEKNALAVCLPVSVLCSQIYQ